MDSVQTSIVVDHFEAPPTAMSFLREISERAYSAYIRTEIQGIKLLRDVVYFCHFHHPTDSLFIRAHDILKNSSQKAGESNQRMTLKYYGVEEFPDWILYDVQLSLIAGFYEKL